MSVTSSYPRILRRILALLTAVFLVLWGTAAWSPADAVEHGATPKATKTNNGNGADKTRGADNTNGADKASGADKKDSGGEAQEPAQPEKTQSTNGASAQAEQSKTSSGPAASKPANKSSDKGDPSGNNGAVKLAGFGDGNGPGHSSGDGSTPMHPSNDPHLPCTFSVEAFGFDASSPISGGTFDQHAPTGGGLAQPNSVSLDGDSHSGGGSTAGYDGVATYTLDWEGNPHPVHGYHVKLTAVTPDASGGSDRKHKVFWVEGCEADTDVPPVDECDETEMPPGEDCEETDVPPADECDETEMPPGEECEEDTDVPPGGETPGDNNGVPDDVDENGGSTSTVVLGAQTSVQSNAQAAQSAAGGGAEVPTAVESGQTGEQQSRSVLPLLAMLFGLGMTGVALVRRRKASAWRQ